MKVAAWAVGLALGAAGIGACASGPRPTIMGADLYAQVAVLHASGAATVTGSRGPLVVRKDQVLVTPAQDQFFIVSQVIEHCRGGNANDDVDCTLALLRDQRFLVMDKVPSPRNRHAPESDEHAFHRITTIVLLAIAAPLTYGVVACEFDGCKAVFGLPLGLDLGLLLLSYTGFK